MSGSLVYKTVQTGRVILYSLLEEVSDKPYFTCEVVTTVSTPDSVENAPVTLYVQRRTGAEHDYEHSNDDRVYKTQARL